MVIHSIKTKQQIYREKYGVVNYTLSCNKDEMAEFKAICDRKGVSRSQILNKLMREYIAKYKEEEDGKID